MLHRNFELLKNGDPSAIAQIYAQYSRIIFWVGKRWLADEFVVESLVQDTFLKLWVHRDRIEDPMHILFFLKFVMKRECISHYRKPRTQFFRKVNSLEDYDNYQDYMMGYDPIDNITHLKYHDSQQKAFNQIKSVLPLLSAKRRHLIELCLKYGFQYKAIAQAMGTSTTDTSNEVKWAIRDIKDIIHQGGISKIEKKPAIGVKVEGIMTEEQKRILELRCKEKQSFAFIAAALNLSEKEVHKEFVTAYKFMQEEQLESV